MWGTGPQQDYFKAGRAVREVLKSQVEAVCKCGYITLKPSNDFERHNGGLTVKRKNVIIIHDSTGKPVRSLRGVNRYYACNACANNWK